jgi:glycerate kinase
VGRRDAAAAGVTEARSLVDHVGEAEAMARPAEGLRTLAARLARQWHPLTGR